MISRWLRRAFLGAILGTEAWLLSAPPAALAQLPGYAMPQAGYYPQRAYVPSGYYGQAGMPQQAYPQPAYGGYGYAQPGYGGYGYAQPAYGGYGMSYPAQAMPMVPGQGSGWAMPSAPQGYCPSPYLLPPQTSPTPSTPGQSPGQTPGQPPSTDPSQSPSSQPNQDSLTNSEPSNFPDPSAGGGGGGGGPGFSEAGAAGGSGTVSLLGDQLGIPALAFLPRLQQTPGTPGTTPTGPLIQSAPFTPSVRNFKIADNESPRPRDRIYESFNFFENVNGEVNRRGNSLVRDVRAYRTTYGFEKTFLEDHVSLGFRIPVNMLTASSSEPLLDGMSTGVGDLTIISKYAFYDDRTQGNLISVGLAVTAPTGPDTFADSPAVSGVHPTILQPFLGYIWNLDRWFVHGFFAFDVPVGVDDVAVSYNDLGLGYLLFRSENDKALVTTITPTVEVHANLPLNHRDAFDFNDLSGTPDVVNVTGGATFGIRRRTTLSIAAVIPVTGPKPFDYELMAQMNWVFGRGRTNIGRPMLNILGN